MVSDHKEKTIEKECRMKAHRSLFLLAFAALALNFFVQPLESNALQRGMKVVPVPVKDKEGNQVALYKESHALVVGISDYSGGWPRLPGVKEDIKAVKAALEAKGFNVLVVEEPDAIELEEAFEDFVLKYGLDPENRLLFYFAGHGYTHKPSYAANDPEEWMGYIVGRDAPDPKKNLAEFLKRAMSMQSIEVLALKVEAKHALFMFDSCFSGAIFALSRAIPKDIQARTAKPVRQFISAGSADQEVPDVSIFRRQFVSALEGEADFNEDGYVTGTELGLFLEESVSNLSRRTQTPQYGRIRHRRLNKGDFVFPLKIASLSAEVAGAQGSDPTASINGSGRQRSPVAEEETELDRLLRKAKERKGAIEKERREMNIHFSKLKELNSIEENYVSNLDKAKAWKEFIDKYPENNPYLGEAKTRLNKLQGRMVSKEMEEKYAELMDAEKHLSSASEKRRIWEQFMFQYPDDNPRMREAQAKVKRWKNTETKEQMKTEFAQLQAMEKSDATTQQKLDAWRQFVEKYPHNESMTSIAREKLKSLEDENRDGVLARLEPPKAPPTDGGSVNAANQGAAPEDMALIQAGEYLAGEPGSLDKVVLNEFYIDVHEVTQRDYQKIMGANPSKFAGGDLPVERVNWNEARKYCKRVGKRLPTAAEWEKAAKAGTATKYYWGDTFKPDQANCDGCGGRAAKRPSPVGSFPPNPWGLYDMAGNVWEWVEDSAGGDTRVLRGGSWVDSKSFVAPTGAYTLQADNRSYDIGFRCVK